MGRAFTYFGACRTRVFDKHGQSLESGQASYQHLHTVELSGQPLDVKARVLCRMVDLGLLTMNTGRAALFSFHTNSGWCEVHQKFRQLRHLNQLCTSRCTLLEFSENIGKCASLSQCDEAAVHTVR